MEKTAQQYRKKPVVIEAVQWDGNADTANKFIGEAYGVDWGYINGDDRRILIRTLEGPMKCNLGDWIIKGVAGEFYPCKPHIFEKTYEPASLSSLPSDSEIEKAAEEYAEHFLGATYEELEKEELWADMDQFKEIKNAHIAGAVRWLRSQLNTGTSQNLKP